MANSRKNYNGRISANGNRSSSYGQEVENDTPVSITGSCCHASKASRPTEKRSRTLPRPHRAGIPSFLGAPNLPGLGSASLIQDSALTPPGRGSVGVPAFASSKGRLLRLGKKHHGRRRRDGPAVVSARRGIGRASGTTRRGDRPDFQLLLIAFGQFKGSRERTDVASLAAEVIGVDAIG